MITSMGNFEHLLENTSPIDQQVGEALVREYYDPVYRLACSILNDPAEADDATQTTFIRAYQALDQYKTGSNFRAWLFTITVNTCRDLLRRQIARRRLSQSIQAVLHLGEQALSPEDTTIQNEHHQVLWRAVQELDEKHRLPVILRFVHSLPVSEIAQVLNTNEGTVHSRLHYAIRKLQARIGDPGETDELSGGIK
jgi:RNA polymerase sigma factor (sigma-70 family)